MAAHVRATVQSERFMAVFKDTQRDVRKEVRASAHRTRDGGAARARVDTAAMRDSLYVSTGSEDGYPAAEAIVEARRPGHAVGPVRPETQDGLTAVVGVGTDYTKDWELGGRWGHQPMLVPSAAEEEPRFIEALRGLFG